MKRITLVLAALFSLHAFAGKWDEMNYGPFLTTSLEVRGAGIVNKAIAIRLDAGEGGVSRGNIFMLYDTDLMNCAAGWSGGFIDWRGIAFDGRHGAHASIRGDQTFANPVGPGWRDPAGKWEDNVRVRGLDKKPYGPLPRDWAHYKGLYVQGNKVVLSYTVGSRGIFEMPSLHGKNVFIRNLHVAPGTKEIVMQVARGAGAQHLDGSSHIVLVKSAGSVTAINPNANEPVIAAAVLGDTGLWNLKDEENLRLRIPASTKAQKLRVLIWSGKRGEVADFSKAVAAVKAENEAPNLMKLTEGGKAKWTKTVETKIQSGLATGPYATDTFILPNENPWKSWMRLGGFDFFKDNRRAAVCTWQGDVWIVEGLDLPKGKLTWRRIAAGMFQPLGLKIVDETIYVCCRDQITRLHDTNDDGEIDFYENFNNDHQVTEHFHEFAMDLQTDDEGNFYFAKAARHAKDGLVPHHGSIIKVSKDGSKSWRIANGFRAPNGVTVNGDGTFFASDQEGHWTPKNRINLIKQDGFYGYMGSYVPGRDPEDYDPPVVWIHNSVDRSPAQQLWVTSDKWGPLKGSLINLSYGTGRLFTVPYEMVDGVPQGGVSRLPIGETPTGVMRGRFHPVDGQLYACGLFGWAGNKSKSGGFYRFRYTGKALHIPVKYSVSKKGVSLTFSEALDKESAADPESYAAEMCNYRRTRGYGSRDYLVSNPDKQGRDKLEITKVTLGPDGRTVLLQMPKLQKCMTLRIQYNIKGAKGKTVKSEINCTVNVLK